MTTIPGYPPNGPLRAFPRPAPRHVDPREAKAEARPGRGFALGWGAVRRSGQGEAWTRAMNQTLKMADSRLRIRVLSQVIRPARPMVMVRASRYSTALACWANSLRMARLTLTMGT